MYFSVIYMYLCVFCFDCFCWCTISVILCYIIFPFTNSWCLRRTQIMMHWMCQDVSGCVRTGGGTGRSSSQYWLWNGWSMAQIHHDPPALVCSVNTQWWWEHQGGQVEKLSKSHHKHPWRPLSWTSCLPAWAWGWQGVVWSRYLVIFLPLCCRNNMMLYRPSKIYICKKCPLSLTKSLQPSISSALFICIQTCIWCI